MTKKELVDLLNENFHDSADVIFYDHNTDTPIAINDVRNMHINTDTLCGDYIALRYGDVENMSCVTEHAQEFNYLLNILNNAYASAKENS